MSQNYLASSSSGRNNFFDEEEIDDAEFLRHPKAGSAGYALPHHTPPNTMGGGGAGLGGGGGGGGVGAAQSRDLEMQRQELAVRRKEIEERTLASSERGLGLLYESEKVGLATAEELTRQKEQLLRTEGRLDDINSTLRNSEKHIQGIRSVFGSIRNYFSGRNSAVPPPAPSSPAPPLPLSSSSPHLQQQQQQLHQSDGYIDHHPGMRNKPGFSQQHKQPVDVDAALDKNLDDMASGLARLKGLAQGLNEELNDHNDLIDRVNIKTEDVKFKVDKQNRDMNKILGKK